MATTGKQATTIEGSRRGFIASADLSSSQYLIVSISAENTVALCTAATDKTMLGALQNAPKTNDAASVTGYWGGGTGLVKAGGNIAIGDWLTSNGSSQAVAASTGGTNYYFGRALHAGVSGDIIEYAPDTGLLA